MAAGIWKKLLGTISNNFALGLGGPQLKNNAGVIEHRNTGDTAFAIARGASPVGDNDLVTKAYADTLATRSIVTAQISGASALPNNSAVEHFIVVSTTGGNGSIGQLYWDDGSNSGTVTVIPATSGSMILTTVALSGGTVTFKADTLYMWDTVAGAWVAASGAGASGSLREIRFAITNAASQSSATQIPANAVVVDTAVEITTPYSAGATIAVGQTGTTNLLQATTDNLPQTAAIYDVEGDTAWGASALAVLVTVAGAPAAGAGFVLVTYCVPDA
jgi:hypothetical protein